MPSSQSRGSGMSAKDKSCVGSNKSLKMSNLIGGIGVRNDKLIELMSITRTLNQFMQRSTILNSKLGRDWFASESESYGCCSKLGRDWSANEGVSSGCSKLGRDWSANEDVSFCCCNRYSYWCFLNHYMDLSNKSFLSVLRPFDHLVGLVVKASASRAEGPGFESRLRRDFFGVESYQWLKNWHSSGYPARRLAL